VFFGALLMAATASAQQQAKIVKIVGKGTATITRGGVDIPVTEGMAVSVGDTINTGAGVDLFVEPYPGVLATLKPNSHAKLEELQGNTAVLDLRGGGNVVAQVEANKGHKFGVRTPKGVAAAKGTVFNITISGTSYTVVTLAGSVLVYTGTYSSYAAAASDLSNNAVSIGAGQAAVDNQATVFAVGADNPAGATAITSAAQVAVAAVAQAAASNLQGGNELAAVMNTVVTAVPNSVAAIVATAAAAAPTQAGELVQAAVNAATTGAQATTIAQAAAQGAAQGVVEAATANGGTVNANTAAQVSEIAQVASQTATQKGGNATDVAGKVSTATSAGATAGLSDAAKADGSSATNLATAAAGGSTTGAIAGSGGTGSAQNIADAAAGGAVQGAANSGVAVNTDTVAGGAGTSGGVVVAPPDPVSVVTEPTIVTPTSPINPDLVVSPSGE
jgi:hypothetical protein